MLLLDLWSLSILYSKLAKVLWGYRESVAKLNILTIKLPTNNKLKLK